MRNKPGGATAIAAIGALCLGLITAGSASADQPLTAISATQPAYTGEEIFDGLILGVGSFAETQEQAILGTPETPVATEDLDVLHAALNEDNPAFFDELAAGVSSSDPYEVRSALLSVNEQMKSTFKIDKVSDVKPNGPCGWSACGDVFAVVTVAVAALVVTIAVVIDAVPLAVDPQAVFTESKESADQKLALDEWVADLVAADFTAK